MSHATDTFIDCPATAYEGQPTETAGGEQAPAYEAPAYATSRQRQALVDELSRRQCRPLTTKILLNINRLTETRAAELLAGGLDAEQARMEALCYAR